METLLVINSLLIAIFIWFAIHYLLTFKKEKSFKSLLNSLYFFSIAAFLGFVGSLISSYAEKSELHFYQWIYLCEIGVYLISLLIVRFNLLKKGILIFLLLIASSFLFNSCNKAETSKSSLDFYLSVKIMRMENNQMVPHSSRFVWVNLKKTNDVASGLTNENGWLVFEGGNHKFDLEEELSLTILNKDLSKSTTTITISPKSSSNFFVQDKSNFGTNLPPEGYHFLVFGLD